MRQTQASRCSNPCHFPTPVHVMPIVRRNQTCRLQSTYLHPLYLYSLNPPPVHLPFPFPFPQPGVQPGDPTGDPSIGEPTIISLTATRSGSPGTWLPRDRCFRCRRSNHHAATAASASPKPTKMVGRAMTREREGNGLGGNGLGGENDGGSWTGFVGGCVRLSTHTRKHVFPYCLTGVLTFEGVKVPLDGAV